MTRAQFASTRPRVIKNGRSVWAAFRSPEERKKIKAAWYQRMKHVPGFLERRRSAARRWRQLNPGI